MSQTATTLRSMEALPLSDEYYELLEYRNRRDDETDEDGDAPQTDEEIAEAVGVSVEMVQLFYSVEPFVEYAPDALSYSTIESIVDALDKETSNEAVAEAVGVSEATVQMFRSFDTYSEFWPSFLDLSKVHYGTLLLWKTTDLSHEEIADAVGVSRHTVHKYLTRRYSKYDGALESIKRAEATAEFLLAIDPNIPDHLDD